MEVKNMLDKIKVPYINLNYLPVSSYSVTTLLPAKYTFSISCACNPKEAIMLARDTAYRNNYENPTLYNTLLVVKNECTGQWAFFIAPISKYPIEEKQIMNTWNQLKEKEGQKLGICNYYQLYDSNYGQLPSFYPYLIALDATPLPSFQVDLLLPQRYQYRPIKAKSPEKAVAFARYISYGQRIRDGRITYANLHPVPYVVTDLQTQEQTGLIADGSTKISSEEEISEALLHYKK